MPNPFQSGLLVHRRRKGSCHVLLRAAFCDGDCERSALSGVLEYLAYRTIEIELVPETFGLLLFGIVGMMKAKPDITDEELATLIAQTLRLDMTVMDPPPWPEHPDAPEER